MRLWSFNAAWVCIFRSVFHNIVESPGLQIRDSADTDDGPEYVDGVDETPSPGSFRFNVSTGFQQPARTRPAIWTHVSVSKLPDPSVNNGSFSMVWIASGNSSGDKGFTRNHRDMPTPDRAGGAGLKKEGRKEIVRPSLTPGGMDERANDPKGKAGDSILADASSSSSQTIGLVVGCLFLLVVGCFVYVEVTAPDDSFSERVTSRQRRVPAYHWKTPPQPLSPDSSPSSPSASFQTHGQVPTTPTQAAASRMSATSPTSRSEHSPHNNNRFAVGSKQSSVSGRVSVAASGDRGGGTGDSPSGIKPVMLCADLTVPLCESWFAVPLDQLEAATYTTSTAGDGRMVSVPILGVQERPLLYANIMPGTLSLSVKPESGILGLMNEVPGGMAHVLDKNSKFYGTFQCIGPLRYRLTHGVREQMRLEFEARTSRMLLVSTGDGGTLASASRFKDSFHPDERLEVRVSADMDPVLSLLCILGSMVVTGNTNTC